MPIFLCTQEQLHPSLEGGKKSINPALTWKSYLKLKSVVDQKNRKRKLEKALPSETPFQLGNGLCTILK